MSQLFRKSDQRKSTHRGLDTSESKRNTKKEDWAGTTTATTP